MNGFFNINECLNNYDLISNWGNVLKQRNNPRGRKEVTEKLDGRKLLQEVVDVEALVSNPAFYQKKKDVIKNINVLDRGYQ